MRVSRDSFIDLRILLVNFMLRAQELLEIVDVIDCKIIEFDFIATATVSTYIQFISHQGAFQDSQMLDTPF